MLLLLAHTSTFPIRYTAACAVPHAPRQHHAPMHAPPTPPVSPHRRKCSLSPTRLESNAETGLHITVVAIKYVKY